MLMFIKREQCIFKQYSDMLHCRKRLFMMINGLPTIYEVVTGVAKKPSKEKTPKSNTKNSKSGSKVINSAVCRYRKLSQYYLSVLLFITAKY